jgi:hypothetical protein
VIIKLMLVPLLDALTFLLELVPDASLPAVASNALDNLAVQIGGTLGGLDQLLPISECAIFVGWVLGTLVPIAVVLQTSTWVWSMLPVIGNGK